MKKEYIIVGAGGFGREVYQWAKDSFKDYECKGFIDDNKDALAGFKINQKIISKITDYSVSANDNFLLAIGNVEAKKKVVSYLKNKGAKFLSLVHPTAMVFPNALIGEGVVLCPFTIVSDSVELGDFTMLNIYSSCGHDSKVGNWSILSPYATLNGFAVLEEDVFIGTHSTVISKVTVKKSTKVAANSFVRKNTKENSIIVGVPGTDIKRG